MTFVDFMKKVNSMYNNHKKKMRYGQILMNFLSEVWPYKYMQIAAKRDRTKRFIYRNNKISSKSRLHPSNCKRKWFRTSRKVTKRRK